MFDQRLEKISPVFDNFFLFNNTPNDPAELDRYGGWTGRTFEATGVFRVEKDDRWWLVTPDGHAFLSFGINHFYTDLWNQDYNREAWRKRLGGLPKTWELVQVSCSNL